MTESQLLSTWYLWLGVAALLVVVAAGLLITVWMYARRIASLAGTALEVVREIEANTKPIWGLATTHEVAQQLDDGAQAIESNAVAILNALAETERPAA